MIGFTGPYSDINFGDYAMLVNNLYALEESQVTIFVYDRPFVEKIRDRYLRDFDVQFVEVEGLHRVLADGRDHRFLTPVEILGAVTNLDEVRDAISQIDVLYVNGGGYLNSLWTQPHRLERLLKIITPVMVAATLNKKIVFTANGYGPFRGDLEFFASFFGSLPTACFGARDTILSPHWLAQAGVRPEQIVQLPDDLLFIDERLKGDGRRPVSGRYVVLETYLTENFIAENISHFEAFSRKLRDQNGLKIVFLPFNLGQGGVEQGKVLAERIDCELFDISQRGYLGIEDAVAIVQNAELVLSNRYHAVILALGLGVPFVSVLKDVLGDKQYYYGKNAGALQTVLRGEPYELRDYLFADYIDALQQVGDNFAGMVERQRRSFARAFQETGAHLDAARGSYFKGRL